MKKKILLSTADLGSIENLKAEPTLMIYKGLYKVDSSSQLYVRDYKNFNTYSVKKTLLFGRALPFCFEFINKYLRKNSKFNISYIKIIDYLFSLKVNKNIELLYVIPPLFPNTTRKVFNNSGVTIMHAGVNHPSFNEDKKRADNSNKPLLDTIKYSKYIFALSTLTKETYVKSGFNKNNIYIVPLGVNHKKYKPSTKKDNVFRVICVADYTISKGFQDMLKVWEKVKLENSELIIIGNPKDSYMKKTIQEYSKKLTNLKTYSHQDPLSFYQQSSVLIHPSYSDSWGKVVTEAMACELPVIASQNTGAKDAITQGKDGFIIKPGSLQEIEEKLLYLYNNSKQRKDMGKMARQKVIQEHTWERATQKAEKAFKDILKKEQKL